MTKTRMTEKPCISFKHHPFPVLLHLEWGLLAIGLVSVLILPFPSFRATRHLPLLPIAIIVIFGCMGLRLPLEKIKARIHTAIAFLLIVLATLLGMRNILFPVLHLYPFFYLILVIRSCLMYRLPGRITVTIMTFILFLVSLLYRVRNSNWIENLGIRIPVLLRERLQERLELLNLGFALTAALLLGLALLFIFLLVNALLSERQSREQVAIANQQLREYALRVEHLAMEQERNRIAREIHDSLGHSLTALNLQLEGVLKLWQTQPERARIFLQEAKQMGSTALQEVRQSVATLRADPLQGKQLESAITSLVSDFQRNTGIIPNCHLSLPNPLPPDINISLYRIIQEALTNISKHAHATQVKIVLQMSPELQLIIQDNGQGFDWQQNQTGFGLQGMRERVLALGGKFAIASTLHQGCQITITLPSYAHSPSSRR